MVPVIVGNILSILTLPLFTRILSVEDYGVYALAQVYAIFINGVSNFGLTVGYERNFFEHSEIKKRAGLLYSTLLFVIGTFILFGVLTFLFKNRLSELVIGNKEYDHILFWSYCAVSLTSLKAYFLTYFKNTENARAYVWYTIDENLITTVLSLIMIGYLKIGIMGLIWSQVISSGLIFLILCFRFLRNLPLTFDFTALRDSLKLSLPLTPRIFFGVIGSQFDKYMIGLLSTVGGVGVYNLGQKFANITFTFMTAIQNVFGPQVYKRMFEMNPEEGGRSIGKYLTPFLYLSIGGGLALSLFGEEAIIILTPKPFHGAINIISILSLLFGAYFFGKQPQLIYAKKTGIISILTFLSIGINILINIPMINLFGVIGAAWGTLISGVISVGITFLISQKYYRIYWEYFKVSAIFLVFFISTMLCILMRDYEVDYLVKLTFKLIFAAIYLYFGIVFKILTKENYLTLKKAFYPNVNTLVKP
jgi:O-antigen/teichoic acid export membrane protein